MTVSSTTTKNSYSGDGSTTAFSYTFKIFDEDDITVVLRNNSTGAETTQTITTNYTVSGVGNAGGGTVTFVTAPPTGNTVVLLRITPLTQLTDYTPNDPFPAESHETALDKLTHITQELQEEVGRSLKLSQTNEIATAEFTTGAADRANKILGFDTNGDLAIFQEIGTFKGTDATTTTADYVERDIVKSTTAAQLNNVYIALQDSPTGTLLTNTTYWALLVDAVSAATSATNAAASAVTAEGHKDDAETAKTAAELAESNAATTYDNFDDRYLGAKSADVLVDNDGDALITGALYFNSTDGDMRVYNGTAWINVVSSLGNLANVVEDSTPQLGGNLDTNGNDIVTTSNANLDLAPNGTGAVVVRGNTNPGTVIFNCESNSHGQTVKAQPHSAAVTNTLTLPAGGNQEIVGTTATQTLTNKSITMADDDALIIGTDTDLTIVHDSGVNNTLFKSDTIEFKSKANANLTFKISPGATKAATLYYQGSERLAIESGTTRFTGGINADTATIASLAYPSSDGTNGQVLTTNGSGTLSFQDVTETDPSALAFAIALG